MNTKKILDIYDKVFYEVKNLWELTDYGTKSHSLIDNLLWELWIKINKETRYIAYVRITKLKTNALINYLDKVEEDIKNQNFKIKLPNNLKDRQKILNRAYFYVKNVYENLQEKFIDELEKENIVDNFDLTLFRWAFNVGKAFNNFFPHWENQINIQNKILDKKFDNDQEKIISYLREKNLLDTDENWNETDRSYSIIRWWKILSYAEAFPQQIWDIISAFELFEDNLKEFNTKKAKQYITYISALKNAFKETNIHKSIEKWQKVDEAWMDIKYSIQISHPLEFYEDKFRKAVAPEWDLRIVDDSILNSKVKTNIESMYEKMYKNFDKNTYSESYNFSKENFNRVQLYISQPVLFFWAELNWLFSAQVVPNDEEVSKRYWKKIFAFPKIVLENQKKTPLLKITQEILDENLIKKYYKLLDNPKTYYDIYDIETIGHEFWHTLFLTKESEVVMNSKTWNFKNIEEFKATSWGLVSYFVNNDNITEFEESMMVLHIMRVIWILKNQNITELTPYYCESIIHLHILYNSWLLKLQDGKVTMDFDNYVQFKKDYIQTYKKLIQIYLDKKDAWDFLYDYAYFDKTKKYYLPNDEKLKDFIINYQTLSKKIWNQVI